MPLVVMLCLLLASGINSPLLGIATLDDNDPNFVITKDSESYIINSDADFASNGFTGNGTSDNPYRLSNKISEAIECVGVRNTRCNFIIQECIFTAEYCAIFLHNVTNAVISSNSLYGTGYGIIVENSNGVQIINNSIEGVYRAMDISYSYFCYLSNNSISMCGYESTNIFKCESTTVVQNQILGGHEGFSMDNCNNSVITRNTFASIRTAIRLYKSLNSSIFLNQFATVQEGYTGVDDEGLNNMWDDNVSVGNEWFDYHGSGIYLVTGTTGSADNFPSKFEPSFPIDFEGPNIRTLIGSMVIDYLYELPSHWLFEVFVNDTSGVDTVLVTVNGHVYEMTYEPTIEEPDRYIYDYAHPVTMLYSYWANDTLGFEAETEEAYITMGVLGGGFPFLNLWLYIYLPIGIVVAVSIFAIWRKHKTIPRI
ncbi:MAG: NosD domain-containing protein [Promethearchaeota archaeon]